MGFNRELFIDRVSTIVAFLAMIIILSIIGFATAYIFKLKIEFWDMIKTVTTLQIFIVFIDWIFKPFEKEKTKWQLGC